MERFLRQIAIIFVLCMVAVILIFIGINYKANVDVKKIKNNKKDITEVSKSEKTKKSDSSIKNKTEKVEEESKEEKENNINEENNINSNNSINNSNSRSSNSNSNNYNYSNSYRDTTIPITKFSARINNNRIYVGTTANITTTIYPENATIKEVNYSSSNTNVAIVSKDGVVTGINPGECYITISVKNVANSGQIKVYVLSNSNVVYSNEIKQEDVIEEDTIKVHPTTPSIN